jgi:hypothetical protein
MRGRASIPINGYFYVEGKLIRSRLEFRLLRTTAKKIGVILSNCKIEIDYHNDFTSRTITEKLDSFAKDLPTVRRSFAQSKFMMKSDQTYPLWIRIKILNKIDWRL